MPDLVTIATFPNPTEAHLAKARLESHGITAVIEDENIIWTDPLYSVAVGGVKLRVPIADVNLARTTLKESSIGEVAEEETCPHCGSTQIHVKSRGRRFAFLSILFFAFPVGTSRRKYSCLDCGHTWSAQ